MKLPRGRILLIAMLSLLFIFFQNCGHFQPAELKTLNAQSANGIFALDPNEKLIWSLNRFFVAGRKMVFYVNPKLFDTAASYGWFYEHNGSPQGCSVHQYETYVHAVEVNCSHEGVIQITLLLSGTHEEELHLGARVENPQNHPGLTDIDLFWPPEMLALGVDGTVRLGHTQPSPTPSPNPGPSGASLYNQNCQACHGSLAISVKRGRTAAQIRKATMTENAMAALKSLSDEEIQKISDALK